MVEHRSGTFLDIGYGFRLERAYGVAELILSKDATHLSISGARLDALIAFAKDAKEKTNG